MSCVIAVIVSAVLGIQQNLTSTSSKYLMNGFLGDATVFVLICVPYKSQRFLSNWCSFSLVLMHIAIWTSTKKKLSKANSRSHTHSEWNVSWKHEVLVRWHNSFVLSRRKPNQTKWKVHIWLAYPISMWQFTCMKTNVKQHLMRHRMPSINSVWLSTLLKRAVSCYNDWRIRHTHTLCPSHSMQLESMANIVPCSAWHAHRSKQNAENE